MSKIIKFVSIDNSMSMIVPDKMYDLIAPYMKDVIFKFDFKDKEVNCLFYDEAIDLTKEQVEYLSSLVPKTGVIMTSKEGRKDGMSKHGIFADAVKYAKSQEAKIGKISVSDAATPYNNPNNSNVNKNTNSVDISKVDVNKDESKPLTIDEILKQLDNDLSYYYEGDWDYSGIKPLDKAKSAINKIVNDIIEQERSVAERYINDSGLRERYRRDCTDWDKLELTAHQYGLGKTE